MRTWIGASALALLTEIGPRIAAADSFTPGTWRDHLTSTLVMYVDLGSDGSLDETIPFAQQMDIIRRPPTTNPSGFREVPIEPQSWLSQGHSEVLNADIEMRLADVPQPMSGAVSEQLGADYPATLTFNLVYDVFVNGNQVLTNQSGSAFGAGMMRIPPDGTDTLTVSKAFTIVGVGSFTPAACYSSNATSSTRLDIVPASTRWSVAALVAVLVGLGSVALARSHKKPAG